MATAVVYDKSIKAIRVKVPGTTEEFYLHPATVRRNDKSAKSIVLFHSSNFVHPIALTDINLRAPCLCLPTLV